MKIGFCLLLCVVSLTTWSQSGATDKTGQGKPKTTGPCEPIRPADAPAAETSDVKLFETVLASAQSLSQWALLIAAGSIATLVGTSYRRPQKLEQRLLYFWFLPGWVLLALSLYYGTLIQDTYIAFRFAKADEATIEQIKTLNHSSGLQLKCLQFSLICFGIWLLSYFRWWILNNDPEPVSKV